MEFSEMPRLIECQGSRMIGILAVPRDPEPIGVMIIVGGPQYRAGSHRQFTLLARRLAEHGFPVLRFDYRGMGDSEGEMRGFDAVGDDIRAALDSLVSEVSGLRGVVLWGLCDAASAALFHAATDDRVTGLVLLNPWVHTEAGSAKTLLKYYYPKRLVSAEFWGKVLRGRLKIDQIIGSLTGMLRTIMGHDHSVAAQPDTHAHLAPPLPERMLESLSIFRGSLLLILSGRDYTAREFRDLVDSDPRWRNELNSHAARQVLVEDADHVFSSDAWRERVTHETLAWLGDLRVQAFS